MVNFFVVDDRISFADLPGYGYAKAPASVKKMFLPMIRTYLSERTNLKIVFLLIDIRRTPDDHERDIITALTERKIPVAVVATKSDKLTQSQRHARAKEIALELAIDPKDIFVSSAEKGLAKRDILNLIESYSTRSQSANE